MTYINNAAIWKIKTKSGETYLSFKADRDIAKGESLNFFNDRFKKEEKHPDFKSSTKVEESQTPIMNSNNNQVVVPDDIPF